MVNLNLFFFPFLPRVSYLSDEEDTKTRTVVPEKAKRMEEINNFVRQLKNAKKIKDVAKSNQSSTSDFFLFFIVLKSELCF